MRQGREEERRSGEEGEIRGGEEMWSGREEGGAERSRG